MAVAAGVVPATAPPASAWPLPALLLLLLAAPPLASLPAKLRPAAGGATPLLPPLGEVPAQLPPAGVLSGAWEGGAAAGASEAPKAPHSPPAAGVPLCSAPAVLRSAPAAPVRPRAPLARSLLLLRGLLLLLLPGASSSCDAVVTGAWSG